MKILLIEDENKIAAIIEAGLRAVGFDFGLASDGKEGISAAQSGDYDLIILDLMLPSMDGIDLLRFIRGSGISLPVIILSAKDSISDKLSAFGTGSNDYLCKPFYMEELIARIRVQLEKGQPSPPRELVVNDFSLNLVSRKITWNNQTSILSQREFNLFELLMSAPNKIFSRKEILRKIWDIGFDPNTNIVDVCVQRVKSKLSRNQAKGACAIETIRGVGYRLGGRTL